MEGHNPEEEIVNQRLFCPVCGHRHSDEKSAEECGNKPIQSRLRNQICPVGHSVIFMLEPDVMGYRKEVSGIVLRHNVEPCTHVLVSYQVSYPRNPRRSNVPDDVCDVLEKLVVSFLPPTQVETSKKAE